MLKSNSAEPALLLALQREGFCFVKARSTQRLLEHCGALPDWPEFAASWNDLAPDAYLAKVGRQRRRRYAVYSASSGEPVRREPNQPHYQSSDYNVLQGDIERWFEPITPAIGDSASLRTILSFSRELFTQLAPATRQWHIEVHQFRIEAKPGEPGEPTPEGVHRDGVDYVLVLLIDRQNIASGTTTIHTADGTLLGSFTLTDALDAALVDDARVLHGVTPVTPLDPTQPAHRDVLVVTLRRAG
ncbi:MAG TPA: 2OG-Fe dioxygenase family protein [Lysobacter sp.]|nr:2OG-Fe dioxygenase family protein [Lysobacter sp.]